jgi:hypothetical protein
MITQCLWPFNLSAAFGVPPPDIGSFPSRVDGTPTAVVSIWYSRVRATTT